MTAFSKQATFLTIIAAMSIGAAHAQADIILHEPFDYTASDITGQNGGTGFSGAWVKVSSKDYPLAPGLEFNGIESTGKAADATLNNRYEASRTFDTAGLTDDGSELWFSALYMVTDGGTNDWAELNFLGGKDGWGVRFDNTNIAAMANNVAGAGDDLVKSGKRNETHLLVGKITFSDLGNDTVEIWLDDKTASGAADSSVSGDFAAPTGVVHLDGDAKRFDWKVDELRLGETLADVTPIPEPASLALLGLGGAMILSRRRKR